MASSLIMASSLMMAFMWGKSFRAGFQAFYRWCRHSAFDIRQVGSSEDGDPPIPNSLEFFPLKQTTCDIYHLVI